MWNYAVEWINLLMDRTSINMQYSCKLYRTTKKPMTVRGRYAQTIGLLSPDVAWVRCRNSLVYITTCTLRSASVAFATAIGQLVFCGCAYFCCTLCNKCRILWCPHKRQLYCHSNDREWDSIIDAFFWHTANSELRDPVLRVSSPHSGLRPSSFQ